MIKISTLTTLDDIDRALLARLQIEGNISNADLARVVRLSAPAVHARVKRLQEAGFIQRYTAVLDREKLGYALLCYVQISLSTHQRAQEDKLRAAVGDMPEVMECYQVTGEHDYVLKVAVRDRQHLDKFVNGRLTVLLENARIRTSLVLAEIKSTTALKV